jgi:hypothetical protein
LHVLAHRSSGRAASRVAEPDIIRFDVEKCRMAADNDGGASQPMSPLATNSFLQPRCIRAALAVTIGGWSSLPSAARGELAGDAAGRSRAARTDVAHRASAKVANCSTAKRGEPRSAKAEIFARRPPAGTSAESPTVTRWMHRSPRNRHRL